MNHEPPTIRSREQAAAIAAAGPAKGVIVIGPSHPLASRGEWRVVYDDGGWNTFNTDPALDGGRALRAFAEECEAGNKPRLQYRSDGEWRP